MLLGEEGVSDRIAGKLGQLVNQGQLPDKLYWFNQLQTGRAEGFSVISVESLPVVIYRHRVAQLRELIP
jgi:hypothetical protein